MLIQHFTMKGRRVPDPMRPGRTSVVGYLTASNNSSLSYNDENGDDVEVKPDKNGWLDVPHEVGEELRKFRNQGSGFYSPEEIDDSVRLGAFEGEAPAVEPEKPRNSGNSGGSTPAKGGSSQS